MVLGWFSGQDSVLLIHIAASREKDEANGDERRPSEREARPEAEEAEPEEPKDEEAEAKAFECLGARTNRKSNATT